MIQFRYKSYFVLSATLATMDGATANNPVVINSDEEVVDNSSSNHNDDGLRLFTATR